VMMIGGHDTGIFKNDDKQAENTEQVSVTEPVLPCANRAYRDMPRYPH
jgi:hypothetical protein